MPPQAEKQATAGQGRTQARKELEGLKKIGTRIQTLRHVHRTGARAKIQEGAKKLIRGAVIRVDGSAASKPFTPIFFEET